MKLPDVSPVAKLVALVVLLSGFGAVAKDHLDNYRVTQLQSKALTCLEQCRENCRRNGIPLERCDCSICYQQLE